MNFKVWRNFFFDKTRLFNTRMKGVVCLSLANITNSRDWCGAFGNAPSDGHLGSSAFAVFFGSFCGMFSLDCYESPVKV